MRHGAGAEAKIGFAGACVLGGHGTTLMLTLERDLDSVDHSSGWVRDRPLDMDGLWLSYRSRRLSSDQVYCDGPSRKFRDGEGNARSQSFFYEKAAPSAAAVRVNTAHQPKTMASAVPRFTLLTHVKPMAVRINVQIRKISNDEARL